MQKRNYDTLTRLEELENLALTPNEKGEINLALAVKIEELKAKFLQNENQQTKTPVIEVIVQNKRQKKLIDNL